MIVSSIELCELLADLVCLDQREVVPHSIQRLEEEGGPAADQPGDDNHDILSTVDSDRLTSHS